MHIPQEGLMQHQLGHLPVLLLKHNVWPCLMCVLVRYHDDTWTSREEKLRFPKKAVIVTAADFASRIYCFPPSRTAFLCNNSFHPYHLFVPFSLTLERTWEGVNQLEGTSMSIRSSGWQRTSREGLPVGCHPAFP